MTAAEQHEALVLFPAYCTLVQYLRPETDVLASSPGDLVGAIAWHGPVQTACMIVAHCPWITEDVAQAAAIVSEIRALCEQARRPRYIAEMGLDVDDALRGPSDA